MKNGKQGEIGIKTMYRVGVCVLIAVLLCGLAAGCKQRDGVASTPVLQEREQPSSAPQPEPEPTSEPEPEPEAPPEPMPVEEPPTVPRREALAMALERGDKLVALTFDDGPYSTGTANMLELLRAEGVRGTFFLVGRNVVQFPDLAREIVADGHQVGNHTHSHVNLTDLAPDELETEVLGTNDLIEEVTGVRPHVLRPTGGRLNDEVQALVGMPILLWSLDPRDWECQDADAVYEFVVSNARDGDIVILHDVYDSTVEAMAMAIPELREQGFFFVTVEELMTLRGEWQAGEVYRSFPPVAEAAQ